MNKNNKIIASKITLNTIKNTGTIQKLGNKITTIK
jgi:hypothetical protein